MGSGIVAKEYQKIVSTLFYITVTVTGVIFLVANTLGILAAAGITQFPEKFTTNQCLFLLSTSVTFMSVLLWFGMVLEVFKSDGSFRTLVSRAFIAGVLGAVLLAVKQALM